jgi:cytochrome c oxidase assembly protein subunit 15
VILQGVLGGLRVVASELVLAKVHGCTGPLFFALCAALVTLTSRPWLEGPAPQVHPAARRLHRWALAVTVALYLEIVLGAQLRHLSPVGVPAWFELWVWLKLITAGLIAVGLVWLLLGVWRHFRAETTIVRGAKLLAALFSLQLVLGAGTWLTNYGWPLWFRQYVWPMPYTVVAEGRLQVLATTTHATIGSLTLAVSLTLALWSWRLVRGVPS